MDLFYHPDITKEDKYTLGPEESRHITRTKRNAEGDILLFTNGRGIFAKARLSLPAKNKAEIKVLEIEQVPIPEFKLTVAISPLRSPARWEWFIEKATELGVSKIQPLVFERTVKSKFKEERLTKLMVSAMKQSQRVFLPELKTALPFKELFDQEITGQKYVAHCEDGSKKELVDVLKANEDVCVIVGPEGDLTNDEIKMAIENGYIPVGLGKHRLRTETAGMVVCQNYNFANRL
ncbi:MAG: 16S rRNA (uracil(1498)-N(3))-methyltransferase [Flavobacteriales bacterium]|nr:16S rRNA (uracil(1498)-N(3))-methyltransferase [Flavobacteriales bacterium]